MTYTAHLMTLIAETRYELEEARSQMGVPVGTSLAAASIMLEIELDSDVAALRCQLRSVEFTTASPGRGEAYDHDT